MKCIFLVSLFLCELLHSQEIIGDSKIVIHLVGEVNNPGKYESVNTTDLDSLRKMGGGWTEWANIRSIVIIRFPRAEGLFGEGEQVERAFINLNKIVNKENGNTFILSDGDIIYIPMKSLIGK